MPLLYQIKEHVKNSQESNWSSIYKTRVNLITSLVSVWWFTRYKQGCILKCSITRVIFDHLRLHMCLLFLPKSQGGIMWTFSSFIQQCFCIKQRGKAKICSQWEHYHPITCGNTARWATPVCKKGSLKHWQYHLSRESIDRGVRGRKRYSVGDSRLLQKYKKTVVRLSKLHNIWMNPQPETSLC